MVPVYFLLFSLKLYNLAIPVW
uniref:Uncharacterized protein n=1 Tax=Arundo donax TaxID=35708 RepID=A0A0A9GHW6_ARUDO